MYEVEDNILAKDSYYTGDILCSGAQNISPIIIQETSCVGARKITPLYTRDILRRGAQNVSCI